MRHQRGEDEEVGIDASGAPLIVPCIRVVVSVVLARVLRHAIQVPDDRKQRDEGGCNDELVHSSALHYGCLLLLFVVVAMMMCARCGW